MASSSVPSPYVRTRFGFRNTFGTDGAGVGDIAVARGAFDRFDGGRGGTGDAVRGVEDSRNTDESAARILNRPAAGMVVVRGELELDEGVDDRTGGS